MEPIALSILLEQYHRQLEKIIIDIENNLPDQFTIKEDFKNVFGQEKTREYIPILVDLEEFTDNLQHDLLFLRSPEEQS